MLNERNELWNDFSPWLREGKLGDMHGTLRARRGARLPLALPVEELRKVLDEARGTHRLMLELICGCGLRLCELIQLRAKDLDLEAELVTVRGGKRDKDRVTILPQRLRPRLHEHLEKVRTLHAAGS